jgi:hypothetical protein
MTSVYTAFLFRQARGRELWCEDAFLPWVLLAQSGAAASLCGWFFGEASVGFLAAYAGIMLVSVLAGQKTPAAEQAHHQMLKHPAFGIGMVFALLAIVFPPAVVVAFALLDWIYIRAGQEVALS